MSLRFEASFRARLRAPAGTLFAPASKPSTKTAPKKLNACLIRVRTSTSSRVTSKRPKALRSSAADWAEDDMHHALYFVCASGFSVKEYSRQRHRVRRVRRIYNQELFTLRPQHLRGESEG